MAVNAAIERLISESDPQWLADAQLVIDFASVLPSAGSRLVQKVKNRVDSRRTFTGYASGIGNVSVKAEGSKVEVQTTYHIERVGHFKVVHIGGEHRKIEIIHYRNSPPFKLPFANGEEEEHSGFTLVYTSNKSPLFFAEIIARRVPLRWATKIKRLLLRLRNPGVYVAIICTKDFLRVIYAADSVNAGDK